MPAPVSMTRPRFSTLGLDMPERRDLGLIGLSILTVGAVYFATSESGALVIGTTSAVATATGMYGRLAMGRWRSAVQTMAGAALVAVLGGPPRLVGVLLITGLVASELIARHAHRSAILRIGVWLALVACVTSLSGVSAAVPVPAANCLFSREWARRLAGS